MTSKKVRIPEDDFTFWLDGDGLPQHRGATQAEAAQRVLEVLAAAERWLELVQEQQTGRGTELQKVALRSEIERLSMEDQRVFYDLRKIAEQLNGINDNKINPANIVAILTATTGITTSPTVKRLLSQWASLHFA